MKRDQIVEGGSWRPDASHQSDDPEGWEPFAKCIRQRVERSKRGWATKHIDLEHIQERCRSRQRIGETAHLVGAAGARKGDLDMSDSMDLGEERC
jgi:hypothetical protein